VIVMELAVYRAWARRHPQLADLLFGLVLTTLVGLAVYLSPQPDRPREPQPSDLLAVGTLLVVVAGRRRWPAALLVLDAVVSAIFVITTGDHHPIVIGAGVIVAYTLATQVDRGRAWAVAGACAVLLFVVGGAFGTKGWWSPENLGTFAWMAAAVGFGDATRSRRAYVAEVEARARRAEETRDQEARRRVAEERLRIARELHDVVAHHIAVISVQAGAAAHVLKTRPEAAGPALATIRRASDTVLKELAAVVGVLRNTTDTDNDADPTFEPTRGLARLSELLDTFAAAGLRVQHEQLGTERELPAVVDLAAYRIVQEALTNAQKYGTGKADLTVAYTPEGIRLTVTNAVPPGQVAGGSGYGLVGMRERATAAGGTVRAGIEDGGRFAVRAELPAVPEVSQ
jgi:signal transduction histidine kinase